MYKQSQVSINTEIFAKITTVSKPFAVYYKNRDNMGCVYIDNISATPLDLKGLLKSNFGQPSNTYLFYGEIVSQNSKIHITFEEGSNEVILDLCGDQTINKLALKLGTTKEKIASIRITGVDGLSHSRQTDPDFVKQEVSKLLEEFKALEPNKALKGLSLLHSMSSLLGKLESIPEELETLAQKMEIQKAKLKSVFSEQINEGFNDRIERLEALPSIRSTQELEDIFGAILNVYKEGWLKFVPEEDHPQKDKIERVDQEVDVLKSYEGKIIPLRERHGKMEDSEEKEQLTTRINALIDEARAALA